MPLHQKETVRGNLLDDIYVPADPSVTMPKYKIPDDQHDPRKAYRVVHDELMLDGNSRQNLATFCQTWAEPEVHQLMDECMDKNMIDKDEYPQTAEIESRCVHMLADLWNSPEAANTLGCSTTGSSEAAMLCGMAMKWRWRAKQKAAGQIDRQPQHDLRPGPDLLAQVCSLLGRRTSRNPDGKRSLDHVARRSTQTMRREYDWCGTHSRSHVHLPVRTGDRGRRSAGQTTGGDRARYSDACRRCQWRVSGTLLLAGFGVGLPH